MFNTNQQNIYVQTLDQQFVSKDEKNSDVGGFKKIVAATTVAALIGAGFVATEMKVPTIFNSVVEQKLILAADVPTDTMSQYLSFIAKYGKTSQSKATFDERLEIFSRNYKRVVEHNASKAPFEMEINEFTDMTDEEFVEKYATLRVPKQRSDAMKDFKFEQVNKKVAHNLQSLLSVGNHEPTKVKDLNLSTDTDQVNESLPESVDWFSDGYVTKPLNQKSCGACWAFSSSAATESLALISGYDDELQTYSIQQLIDCDEDNYACAGGWMYEGFQYISEKGIVLQKDYEHSYNAKKNSCAISDHELEEKVHIKGIGYVENDGRTNQELKELLQVQPISVAVKIASRMSGYKSGVFTEEYLNCSDTSKEVDHGVLLVGYGKVDKEGPVHQVGQCDEYWIVRNSWGDRWGHDGFFKICMDGVGSDATPLGTCLINKYATWPLIGDAFEM